ncbi:TlpA disulfide reductase family protein [Imtechella halotolerans]|uniref:Alkyl hydroperoxide reductase n=1 Tax=Imtechella halotolerans K1 TaxID=946077 RepID=I0W7E5_9FLAO|nr:TlpA disulfide reductase family protein [Imtechella halotolerans]EID72311.1 alkyl hydroperoxide reductase [Imtechella halotolerans K1]WMQ64413.1 TlpA disulfide reductase family protein [Imtechella halotolerans]
MKNLYIYFTLILLITGCTTPQTTYSLKGTIEDTPTANKAYLINSQGDTLQKVEILNNQFKMEGGVTTPEKVYLAIGEHFRTPFILENIDAELLVAKNGHLKAPNGSMHSLVYGYQQDSLYLKVEKDYKDTSKKEFTGLDFMDEEATKLARSKVEVKFRNLRNVINEYQKDIIENSENTLAKVIVLSENYDWKRFNVEQRLKMLNQYREEIGDYPMLIQLINGLEENIAIEEKRKTVMPGKPFKEVTAFNKEGDTILLSDIVKKNTYTMLEFWASWCGPCRGEIPHLKKAYETYKDKGFEIYALSIDDSRERWIKAMDEDTPPWINVVDHAAFKSDPVDNYAIDGIPASFLIDNQGKIIATAESLRGFELDRLLLKLMSENN